MRTFLQFRPPTGGGIISVEGMQPAAVLSQAYDDAVSVEALQVSAVLAQSHDDAVSVEALSVAAVLEQVWT